MFIRLSPSRALAFVFGFRLCQNCEADLIIAIPIYLFPSSSVILLIAMTNLVEVSHLLRVEDISGLQSKSRYNPKGFIPSGLNISIGELFSSFIALNTEVAPFAVGVLEYLGRINLSVVEDSG